jgi:hypothetical protein
MTTKTRWMFQTFKPTMKEYEEFVAKKCQEALADEVYHPIRADVIESIWMYVTYGIEPGSFVRSVLENDLTGALSRADSYNSRTLKEIGMYVYMEVPSNAWGNSDRVSEWMVWRMGVGEKE